MNAALQVSKVLKDWLLGHRVPLFVSWNLTYRCNLSCRYCGLHRPDGPEASTTDITWMIAELARLGARYVGFSGGEPLVRSDFASIVAACRDHGLTVSIQTNGSLLPRRIRDLPLREVRVSLDGPREVHDEVRGRGSFEAAVRAIRSCQDRGIPVLATAVLTARSIPRLPEFLDLAESVGVGVIFQPMDARFAGNLPSDDPLYPQPVQFRYAVDSLIRAKSQGRSCILNSLAGLRYLRGWPEPDPIRCGVGRLMCTVDADGRVFVCDMYPRYTRFLVSPDDDLRTALDRVSLPARCPRCITGAMCDLNLAASGQVEAAWGLLARWFKTLRSTRGDRNLNSSPTG